MKLQFKDARTASSIVGAIAPEQETAPSRRTQVSLRRKGRQVTLDISAKDTTSMRAAVNSYLRWFILAKRITEATGDD